MCSPYLLTFEPVERYFFGGNNSFSESYFVRSMQYPTPMSLLGAIRYTMLKQNGLLKKPGNRYPDFALQKDQIYELTGKSEVNGLEEENDNFGKIARISAPFIVKRGTDENSASDYLFQIPADIRYKDKKCKAKGFDYLEYKDGGDEGKYNIGGVNRKFTASLTRDNKQSLLPYLGGSAFWEAYCGETGLPVS